MRVPDVIVDLEAQRRHPLAWMPLVDAARWVAYGHEGHEDVWGDPEPIRALVELRAALSRGEIEAFGFRGNPEISPPLSIHPAAWTARRLPLIEFADYSYEPYSLIVVDRAKVLQKWPPTAAPRAIGRPAEFSWDRVREMAAQEKPGMGRGKLCDVLRARYEAELGRTPPSETAMKEKLREWDMR